MAASRDPAPQQPPNFCSGCPHNRSTLLLEGQVAGGGIGCHAISAMLGESYRDYRFCTHMGGEGVPWIGMSAFTGRGHIFQNIGDGTYFHSGSLAVQSCIAAGVNITFKILYNGHVAMTGGQAAMGALPVVDLTRKLEAEGVEADVRSHGRRAARRQCGGARSRRTAGGAGRARKDRRGDRYLFTISSAPRRNGEAGRAVKPPSPLSGW